MSHRSLLFAGLLLLAAVSTITCSLPVPAVYPLALEGELVFDPELLGYWVDMEDPDGTPSVLYSISRPEKAEGYIVEVTTEDCEEAAFVARLADLGPAHFLIATAEADELLFAMPTYSFFRVEVSSDAVDLTMLDADWLRGYLESDPDALSHLRDVADESGLLLTASTAELRDFHLEHLETPGAWSEAERNIRREAGEAAALRARWCADEASDNEDTPEGGESDG